jgi:hypothetical protein
MAQRQKQIKNLGNLHGFFEEVAVTLPGRGLGLRVMV